MSQKSTIEWTDPIPDLDGVEVVVTPDNEDVKPRKFFVPSQDFKLSGMPF